MRNRKIRYSTFDYSERIKELKEDIKESILTGEINQFQKYSLIAILQTATLEIKETKLKEEVAEDEEN